MFTIYTQDNCPNCLELKNVLKQNNIQYTELDVNQSYSAKAKMIMNDIETTPAVEINNQLFAGNVSDLTKTILGNSL